MSIGALFPLAAPLWVPAGTVTNAATSGTTTVTSPLFLGLDGSGNVHCMAVGAPDLTDFKATTAGVGAVYVIKAGWDTRGCAIYDPGTGKMFTTGDDTVNGFVIRFDPAAPATAPTTAAAPFSSSVGYAQALMNGKIWALYGVNGIAATDPSALTHTTYAYPSLGGVLRVNSYAACDGGDGYLYIVTTNNTNVYLDRVGTGALGTTAGTWSNIATIDTTINAEPTVGVHGVCKGGDGNFWSTGLGANKVYKITPGGVVTALACTGTASQPKGICAGGDGNIWYVESAGTAPVGRRIVQVNISTNAMTAYTVSTANGLSDIIPGADNASLYVAANGDGKIYKFV